MPVAAPLIISGLFRTAGYTTAHLRRIIAFLERECGGLSRRP
jgi:hypothetical protein